MLQNDFCQENYKLLLDRFEEQVLYSYCGVASATIVLNALSNSSNVFVQLKNISESAKKKDKQVISFRKVAFGMTLKQLKCLFEFHSLNAEIYYAKDISLGNFRDLAVTAINRPRNFIVINYLRMSLGQLGYGHFSPLGGYNSKEDRFLIMDVASSNNFIWVTTEALYYAMKTSDFLTGRSRGFIVVTKNSS